MDFGYRRFTIFGLLKVFLFFLSLATVSEDFGVLPLLLIVVGNLVGFVIVQSLAPLFSFFFSEHLILY